MSLDARARRAARAARTNVDRLPPPPAIGVLVARRRRRAAAANALALVLIVAVVGVAWRALPHEPATRLPGHVQAAIRVGRAPGAVLVAGGSVWVANSGDGTVSRIDPATNRVIATIHVDGDPAQLTADSGAVWVATAEATRTTAPARATLQRIDPATNRVVQTLPLPDDAGVGDVLAADGRLWVSLNDGTVQRLDTADGRVLASISLASQGVSVLASGSGMLWAAKGSMLVAISPQRAAVTERFIDKEGVRLPGGPPPGLTNLALVGGVAWESTFDGRVFRFRVDPPTKTTRGQVVASLDGPASIAVGPTGVFVASPRPQTVTRLDPATGQVRASIRLPGLRGVAVGPDAVWATTEAAWTTDNPGILYRIDPQATD